jgi:hypothetical protein
MNYMSGEKLERKVNKIIVVICLVVSVVVLWQTAVIAAPLDSSGSAVTEMYNQQNAFLKTSGIDSSANVPDIIKTIIQVFLSLLSMIFIILILYAGFNWMTAGGEEKKVEDAKATIQRAIIGLVIVIAAFAITYFVFNALPFGGSGGGGSITGGGS